MTCRLFEFRKRRGAITDYAGGNMFIKESSPFRKGLGEEKLSKSLIVHKPAIGETQILYCIEEACAPGCLFLRSHHLEGTDVLSVKLPNVSENTFKYLQLSRDCILANTYPGANQAYSSNERSDCRCN